MTDHELQQLYASLQTRPDAGREGCVAPADLMRLAAGDATEVERLDWLGHVAGCTACAAELKLTRAVAEAGQGLERPRIPAAWLALAASVLLLLGGVALWRSGMFAAGDVMRGGAEQVTLVAPRGTVPAAAAGSLVWRAVARAQAYDVEILDPAGSPALAGSTTDTTLAVPAGTLRFGVEYRWRVTAVLPDGTRRHSAAELLRVRTP